MLKCVNVTDLIRNTTLDMMESRPFYRIKVSDLTAAANIGRSTFYLHYDSIYDVVEEIENDFINGLMEESSVLSSDITFADSSQEDDRIAYLEMMNAGYILEHARTFQLLTGPNGDPSFTHKLSKRIRTYLSTCTKKGHSGALPDRYFDLLAEFIVNGNIAFHRYYTSHPDLYTEEEISFLHQKITDQLMPLLTSYPVKKEQA